ncbi:MAG TPA: hypothetical protein PKL18_08940, partial [Accumulibacter sp.]|nr:hypothetical protein [Accumulibacter sp.]
TLSSRGDRVEKSATSRSLLCIPVGAGDAKSPSTSSFSPIKSARFYAGILCQSAAIGHPGSTFAKKENGGTLPPLLTNAVTTPLT